MIEWTAQYELPNVAPGETFTSKAYSIAYAPNSAVTGAYQAIQHTGQGGGSKGIMVWENSATFFMAGLQNIQLETPFPNDTSASTRDVPVNPGSPWLYPPTGNLSNYVLNAEGEVTYKAMTATPFGGNINWRSSADLSKVFFTNGIGHDYNSEGGRPSGVQTNVNSGYHIVYRSLRNNIQATGLGDRTWLEAMQSTGRYVEHWVRHGVGSMEVDSSRFSNLGQVPGMHFASFYPNFSGNTNNGPKEYNIRMDTPAGNYGTTDYIKFGTLVSGNKTTGYVVNGYNQTLTYPTATGQHFSSDGRQITITAGEGTQTIVAEALYTAFYNFYVVERVLLTNYDIKGMAGNRAVASFNFALNKTDKSILRTAALEARYSDEFYVDGDALNTRLATVSTRLGDPKSSNKTVPVNANVLDIGEGMSWEIGQEPVDRYTATFNTRGGNTIDPIEADAGTKIYEPDEHTRENYDFQGWFTDAELTVPAVWPHTLTADITFYAAWLGEENTVTFDANGGEGGTTITANYGDTLNKPFIKREGYTLIGWIPAVPPTVSGDAVYVAQWVKTSMSVRLADDDKIAVDIEGYSNAYHYQIWTYRLVTSDLELNDGENVTANQWVLSMPYTQGSEGSASGNTLTFLIDNYQSPNGNYGIVLKIADEEQRYLYELADSYTSEDIGEAKITKI
ncbi:MAG TPA: InlB B-repeat-containing protein, partial [Oscillospiraceae bacterium]|nr:InlB B-repeat-containing protein [Oscillospiraceae bacterium]